MNDSGAFLPHLLPTVWSLLFLSSSPPALPFKPLSFTFLSCPLALLTTTRLSPFTSKQHSSSFLLLFPPISPQTCSLFPIFCSFFLFSPTFGPPEGDPSPIVDSHRPPPPHTHTHTCKPAPIPPLLLVLSVLPHCSSTPPLSVSPPAAANEMEKGEGEQQNRVAHLMKVWYYTEWTKKEGIICLGSEEIKHAKARES